MLAGRHVVVTGAGRGIGRAIARRLARDGATLSFLARGVDDLRATAEEIGGAFTSATDIREREAVDAGFAAAAEANGPIHALIANSGIGGPNEAGEGDRFYDLVQTNLVGTYDCVRAAQRHLAPDGRRDVVVISSILARIPVPGYTGYSASKAGLLGLVRSFAAELAPDDVQVNAICPGWVATDMAREGIGLLAEALGVSYDEAFEHAMR